MTKNQVPKDGIRGVICALLTPLTSDGSIDADGIRQLAGLCNRRRRSCSDAWRYDG